MKSNGKDEHDSDDDGDDVEGDHGDGPPVPAVEHGGVAQLYEEDVDNAHGAEQQGLYCDRKTQKYRHGQVTAIKMLLCVSFMQIRFGTYKRGREGCIYTIHIVAFVITSAYRISGYNEEEGTTGVRDDSEF